MNNFDIRFDWIGQEAGDDLARATFAHIEVEVAGLVVTELQDQLAKTVRGAVVAPAYDLALWFASNWWRLRWEPRASAVDTDWRLSHSLAGAGGGTIWPTVDMWSTGETVRFVSTPTSGSGTEPIRYLQGGTRRVTADVFETGIDRFVDAVVDRVVTLVRSGTELEAIWAQVTSERANPELAAWRRVEAKLGFDPDEAPERLITELEQLADEVGEAAMEEVAISAGRNAPVVLRSLTEALITSPKIRVPNAAPIQEFARRVPVDPRRPWIRGLEAARVARNTWSVASGPISTAHLGDLLSLPESDIVELGPTDSVEIAGADRRDDGSIGVVLKRTRETGRRFALARLVGDHLLGPESDRLLPATHGLTTRQKLQRAFAQELLCPYADLASYVGDAVGEEEIEAAADHFNVSPVLIDSTLRNNRHDGYEL